MPCHKGTTSYNKVLPYFTRHFAQKTTRRNAISEKYLEQIFPMYATSGLTGTFSADAAGKQPGAGEITGPAHRQKEPVSCRM